MNHDHKFSLLNAPEIDLGCLQLFNELCNQKALLPLTYLLHTWPITGFSDAALQRLYKTLESLVTLSDSDLTPWSRELCRQLISNLELRLSPNPSYSQQMAR
ncbi:MULTISPECIES: hypothetical protein [Paraburkholderia]|uniref:Uncharacterized protein n=2 Tax=Paraburkholderia TaxID=1822464 RepID=A0A7Z0B1A9_9BURK|nr:hypothetical protein [Paraburkholderia bryophila]NYH16683.1 hypothetical protein [Paraburkholderia bryophila]NYH24883.1 hypothetical protein [Paraburkholderia bryophila]